MGLSISNSGINLIKQFEGCRLSAYRDSVGVITIGYGWTKAVDGKPLTMGMTITQTKAESLLKTGLASYEANVNKYHSRYHWTQNQFDALVSFAYNLGSIDRLVHVDGNTSKGYRTVDQISAAIPTYCKAGGKTLSGLVKRRNKEKALFDCDIKDATPNTPPPPTFSTLLQTGLTHAKKFTGTTDTVISVAKARVLQHALNLDYTNGQINEDGLFGAKSKKKLGNHYVTKGETQYMVTAAEILMYLNGVNPNGVEFPGKYGNGLVNAAKCKFGGTGMKITANNFVSLLN